MRALPYVICGFFTAISCKMPANYSQTKSTTSQEVMPWPYGTVPYSIDTSVPASLQTDIESGIASIQALNIVSFVNSNGDKFKYPVAIEFKSVIAGCYANGIGAELDQNRIIYVSKDCTAGDILHEIMHALGMLDEQINPNANIQVLKAHIQTGKERSFAFPNAQSLHAYDPASIMHAASDDFSICDKPIDAKWNNESLKKQLPHISCKRPDWRNPTETAKSEVDCLRECATMLDANNGLITRQREKLSAGDVAGLKLLYKK